MSGMVSLLVFNSAFSVMDGLADRNAPQTRLEPRLLAREDVRCYLELLVDGGGSSSWVSINLSAIRTAYDKMCGYAVTLGLQSPRRPKRLPVVLSQEEIMRLLQAAPSLREKLLLGLMYATARESARP